MEDETTPFIRNFKFDPSYDRGLLMLIGLKQDLAVFDA